MTNTIERPVNERKMKMINGFISKYYCTYLVYFEETGSMLATIEREKQLKRWNESKKNAWINTVNPKKEVLSGEPVLNVVQELR